MKADIDKAPVFMTRTPAGLAPATPFDAERLDRVAWGVTVEVRIRQRRSAPQNRLYWAVLAKAVENLEGFPSAAHLHDALKEHLGFVEPYTMISGEVGWRVQSAAFDKMDAATFKAFMDRAIETVAGLLGTDPDALIAAAKEDVA